jgi:hypothetical protein
MQSHIIIILAIAMPFLLVTWPEPLRAEQVTCTGTSTSILVEGSHQENLSKACDAVRSASRFFRAVGLAAPTNITIRLEAETPSQFPDDHEIGHYNAKLDTIVIQDYRATTNVSSPSMSGLWAIDLLPNWQSYIVHELAHAAIHADCDKHCPSRAIDEYIAAVAQISVLPEEYRSILLDSYRNLEAWENEYQITETYYAFDPHKFAIKSYKHYMQQSDPQAFLRTILAQPRK